MAEQLLTREFSICLVPSTDVRTDIQALRQELPPSPYRDDSPHITLLRGITSSIDMDDEALVQEVGRITSLSANLPKECAVRSIANKSNEFYSATGLILLESSPELLAFRQDTVNGLQRHGYTIESQGQITFTPHVTIRLGVPLEGDSLQKAETQFKGRVIAFSEWLLLRLVIEDGKRLMHEVRPTLA